MDKRLKEYNWAYVNNANDVDEAVCTISNVIGNMFNDCFPLIKVRVSSKDPPFMTPLVKHLCKIRNRQIEGELIRKFRKKLINSSARTRLVLFGAKVESSNEVQKNGGEQLTKSRAEKQIMIKLVP